jgi:hypothetical protein
MSPEEWRASQTFWDDFKTGFNMALSEFGPDRILNEIAGVTPFLDAGNSLISTAENTVNAVREGDIAALINIVGEEAVKGIAESAGIPRSAVDAAFSVVEGDIAGAAGAAINMF